MNTPRSAFLAAALAAIGHTVALATPVTYTFSASKTIGLEEPPAVQLIGGSGMGNPTITVSGQFTYDSDAAYTGNTADLGYQYEMAMYEGTPPALFNLSGTVTGGQGSWTFFDARGAVDIANDLSHDGFARDVVHLRAEPAVNDKTNEEPFGQPHDLQGFILSSPALGDYMLANVRLFWLSGTQAPFPDLGELVDSTALPKTLPTQAPYGLALDFTRLNGTDAQSPASYYAGSIFFESNVSVQAVPEAGSLPLMLLGTGLMALLLHRRRA